MSSSDSSTERSSDVYGGTSSGSANAPAVDTRMYPVPPHRFRHSRPMRLAVLGLVAVIALIAVAVSLESLTRTAAGEAAVIRNGGPLDNNTVRQIVQPASAVTWTGLFSSRHRYPATQRFYKISADPAAKK